MLSRSENQGSSRNGGQSSWFRSGSATPDVGAKASRAPAEMGSARPEAARARVLDPAAAASSTRREPEAGGRSAPAEAERRERLSVHVYAGKAALCFEADETRGNPARGVPGVPTVALDAAPALGEREYDWKNRKIRIQMTRLELPQVLAVLIGASQQCEFKNHGPENNKGFSIENQGDKFFVRVFGPGEVRAVPMPFELAYAVTELVVRQMQMGTPWLSGDGIVNLVRSIKAGMRTVTAANGGGAGRQASGQGARPA